MVSNGKTVNLILNIGNKGECPSVRFNGNIPTRCGNSTGAVFRVLNHTENGDINSVFF